MKRVSLYGVCIVILATAQGCVAGIEQYYNPSVRFQHRISQAIDSNDIQQLTQLLSQEGSKARDMLNVQGARSALLPLSQAILNKNRPIVQLLLNYGADVDATKPRGVPALTQAIFMGDLAMVKLLLNNNANIDLFDGKGQSPLVWAINNRVAEIAKELLIRGAAFSLDEYNRLTPANQAWVQVLLADPAVISAREDLREIVEREMGLPRDIRRVITRDIMGVPGDS